MKMLRLTLCILALTQFGAALCSVYRVETKKADPKAAKTTGKIGGVRYGRYKKEVLTKLREIKAGKYKDAKGQEALAAWEKQFEPKFEMMKKRNTTEADHLKSEYGKVRELVAAGKYAAAGAAAASELGHEEKSLAVTAGMPFTINELNQAIEAFSDDDTRGEMLGDFDNIEEFERHNAYIMGRIAAGKAQRSAPRDYLAALDRYEAEYARFAEDARAQLRAGERAAAARALPAAAGTTTPTAGSGAGSAPSRLDPIPEEIV